MIDVNSIKKGMTLIIDGNICQIVDFLHVKPGKGSAFMKAKYKNLRTGTTLEQNFNTNIKFEEARIDRQKVQFLSCRAGHLPICVIGSTHVLPNSCYISH